MANSNLNNMKNLSLFDLPKPIVFNGPSGSGKSTLIKMLEKDEGDCVSFSVSHTTRKPRPGEKDGVAYHFTSRENMLKAIKNDEFIESTEFSGNLYGTSKRAVEDVQHQCKICMLDIDMPGVQNVRKTDLNPIYIFLKPPSMDVLEQRLRARKTESEEAIQKRLETAKKELKFIQDEYEKGSIVITNDDKDVAYSELRAVIDKEIAKVKKNKKINTTSIQNGTAVQSN